MTDDAEEQERLARLKAFLVDIEIEAEAEAAARDLIGEAK